LDGLDDLVDVSVDFNPPWLFRAAPEGASGKSCGTLVKIDNKCMA
jgi:hypothetical protein